MERMEKQEIVRRLTTWRDATARKKGVELFMILQNATISALAEAAPETRGELAMIKGLGPKKIAEFGDDIIAIVNGEAMNDDGDDAQDTKSERSFPQGELSVSAFLDRLSFAVGEASVGVLAVRGEISEIGIRQQGVFMTLKDKEDESTMNCYMGPWAYGQLGFPLEEGMEIKVYGTASIYKPYGRLSFVVRHIELAGEGALRKAYELLKKKLQEEGLFDRKRPLPAYIHSIGIITSRSGAVIDDFRKNLDKLGSELSLYSVNVEGAYAVEDIVRAIGWFNKNMPTLDALVIIRGGGSLESMQAFNTDRVVRAIFASKIPTICGIGHDKDIPIASLVGDVMTSTPSIAATIINKSWDPLRVELPMHEQRLFSLYDEALADLRSTLSERTETFLGHLRSIFTKFRSLREHFAGCIRRSLLSCETYRLRMNVIQRGMLGMLERALFETERKVASAGIYLEGVNPERNLKLGYSIIRTASGAVVRSIEDVSEGEYIRSQLSDGSLTARVEKKEQKI